MMNLSLSLSLSIYMYIKTSGQRYGITTTPHERHGIKSPTFQLFLQHHVLANNRESIHTLSLET